MIELPAVPYFTRIYKTCQSGKFRYQSVSAKSQEEFDKIVASLEKQDYFVTWVGQIRSDTPTDYYLSRDIDALNRSEEARPKSNLEQLEVALHEIAYKLRHFEEEAEKLKSSHAAALELFNKIKKEQACGT